MKLKSTFALLLIVTSLTISMDLNGQNSQKKPVNNIPQEVPMDEKPFLYYAHNGKDIVLDHYNENDPNGEYK